MPKGRVAVRTMICRHCGHPFDTDRIGRQAWYCHGEACDESRRQKRLKQDSDAKRRQRRIPVVVASGPMREQPIAVARVAVSTPPVDARLRVAVAAYRLNPTSATARQIAAAALAIAADLAAVERQIAA